VLGSTFEAIVGAVYLDAGLNKVEDLMEPLLEGVRERVLTQSEMYDSKSRFQEWAQSEKLGIPRYTAISSSGPEHVKTFEVEVRLNDRIYGHGSGKSKQIAAQAAAERALESVGLR
jgi:ribonuclease-3